MSKRARPGYVNGQLGGRDEDDIAIGNLCQWRYISRIKWRFDMPTRNVNLTDDQDAFVEKMVKAGKYQNASEAMRDAVRGLQQRWKEDELKLELLRKSIDAGITDLETGNYEDVDDAALEGWLDRLGETGRA
jgi:antitoxin ParD1/3/4